MQWEESQESLAATLHIPSLRMDLHLPEVVVPEFSCFHDAFRNALSISFFLFFLPMRSTSTSARILVSRRLAGSHGWTLRCATILRSVCCKTWSHQTGLPWSLVCRKDVPLPRFDLWDSSGYMWIFLWIGSHGLFLGVVVDFYLLSEAMDLLAHGKLKDNRVKWAGDERGQGQGSKVRGITRSLVAAADGMAFDGGDDSHWCGWMMLEVIFRFGAS